MFPASLTAELYGRLGVGCTTTLGNRVGDTSTAEFEGETESDSVQSLPSNWFRRCCSLPELKIKCMPRVLPAEPTGHAQQWWIIALRPSLHSGHPSSGSPLPPEAAGAQYFSMVDDEALAVGKRPGPVEDLRPRAIPGHNEAHIEQPSLVVPRLQMTEEATSPVPPWLTNRVSSWITSCKS